MNILISPAHNYIMPYGIMLTSLYEHNSNQLINVYAIVDEDVTEEDKQSLNNVANTYRQPNLYYILFPLEKFNCFPGLYYSHLNRAAYYRIFVGTLLPDSLDKVLYLDGDIIVKDNIKTLWECDLNGAAVGVVLDHNQTYEQYNRLHYSAKKLYFNSGHNFTINNYKILFIK